MGDAGHGAIDSEELVTTAVYAGGLVGHGYAYTIGRGGRALQAVGESLHSPYDFRRYVDERAVGVVQIDPITNGGITASMEALRMADAAGLPTSSHYTDELGAHLLCASANPVYLEKDAFALDRYLVEPQRVVDGRVRPPETPGTGMRFDPARLEPHRG
jgi:L-alanine-DL-glutamate epimerase-like enolase superfamily enzyme